MKPTKAIRPDQLVEHAAFIRGLARSLVGDESAADDVTQDAFVNALRRPPSIADRVRPWLRTVVKNVVRQRIRGEGRREAREALAEDPREEASPIDVVSSQEMIVVIGQAVWNLPPMYREAVVLKFYEDLTPPEIAARLKLPVETVRTRLKRALALLRTGLDERCDGDRKAWVGCLSPFLDPVRSSSLMGAIATVVAFSLLVGTAYYFTRVPGPASSDHSRTTEDLPSALSPGFGTEVAAEHRSEIAGRPRLMGRVVDPAGRAIPFATATVWTKEASIAISMADQDGRFETDLALGDRFAEVFCSAPGFLEAAFRPVWNDVPGVIDCGDLVLRSEPGINGRVIDEEGRPVEGAILTLKRMDGSLAPPHPSLRLDDLDRAPSSGGVIGSLADGSFSLRPESPGAWCVVASASGRSPALRHIRWTGTEHAGHPLIMELPKCEGLRGVLRINGEAAPRRIDLVAPELMTPSRAMRRQVGRSDRSGAFGFDRVCQAFPQTLRVWVDEHTVFSRPVEGPSSEIDLAISLDAEFLVRVVDASGTALNGAGVAIAGQDRHGRWTSRRKTDATGLVVFRCAPGSLESLYVTHPSCGTVAIDPPAFGGSVGLKSVPARPSEIPAGQSELRVEASTAGSLRGRITDDQGMPVAGVRVAVFDPLDGRFGMLEETRTDDEGRYVFVAMPDLLLLLELDTDAYWQSPTSAAVAPNGGGDRTHDVVVERAATIVGRVVDARGTPVRGAPVRAVAELVGIEPETIWPTTAITDKDGEYRLGGVRAGAKVQVETNVLASGQLVGTPFLAIAGEETRAPDLVVTRAGSVRVDVVSPSGAAVRGARLALVNLSSFRAAGGFLWDEVHQVGPDGFLLSAAVDVDLVLVGSHPEYASVAMDWSTSRGPIGEGAVITLTLRRPEIWSGHVLDSSRRPVVGAEVQVTPLIDRAAPLAIANQWFAPRLARTGEDGDFLIDSIPFGFPCRIEVRSLKHALWKADLRTGDPQPIVLSSHNRETRDQMMRRFEEMLGMESESDRTSHPLVGIGRETLRKGLFGNE